MRQYWALRDNAPKYFVEGTRYEAQPARALHNVRFSALISPATHPHHRAPAKVITIVL